MLKARNLGKLSKLKNAGEKFNLNKSTKVMPINDGEPPRKRMFARSLVCTLVAVCVIIPCLNMVPLCEPANALLPATFLDNESGNGWKKSYSQVDEYGLGLASTSIYLYTDDAKDEEGNEDGYPAILFVIVLKMPF